MRLILRAVRRVMDTPLSDNCMRGVFNCEKYSAVIMNLSYFYEDLEG